MKGVKVEDGSGMSRISASKTLARTGEPGRGLAGDMASLIKTGSGAR